MARNDRPLCAHDAFQVTRRIVEAAQEIARDD